MSKTPHRRIILDLDSSESPVHGAQEGSAYHGHFGSTCFHPLFCFNQWGDCEGELLRPGNVHSADRWKELLDPVVQRYESENISVIVDPIRGRGEDQPLPGCPKDGVHL